MSDIEARIKRTEQINQEKDGQRLIGMHVYYDDSTIFTFYAAFPLAGATYGDINITEIIFPAIFQKTANRALELITTGKGNFYPFDAVISDEWDAEDPLVMPEPALFGSRILCFADGSRLVFGSYIPRIPNEDPETEIDLALEPLGALVAVGSVAEVLRESGIYDSDTFMAPGNLT